MDKQTFRISAWRQVKASDPPKALSGKLTELWDMGNFVVDLPIKTGDFHSYVKLPGGSESSINLATSLGWFTQSWI